MSYLCGNNCPRSFSTRTPTALTLHRKTCAGFLQTQRAAAKLRQRVASATKGKKKSKLKDRKLRTDVNEPGSSGLASENHDTTMDMDEPSQPSYDDFDMIPEADLRPPITLSPPAPPAPQLSATGRPHRNAPRPKRYQDLQPEPPAPAAEPEPEPEPLLQRIVLIVHNRLKTASNSFGVWREYLYRPSYDPDLFVSPEDLYIHPDSICSDSNSESTPTSMSAVSAVSSNLVQMAQNATASLLMGWQNSGSQLKSDGELNSLVHDVLLHPDFKVEELLGFSAQKFNRQFDKQDQQSPLLDTFQEGSVGIEVPSGDKHVPPKNITIPGLQYRKFTSLIRAAFNHPLASKFHYSPYKLFYSSPITGKEERIFSEVYDSDAFIDEHAKIQRAPLPPDNPDCKLEKVIAACMVWSDGTHLANFGTAKLWPIYILFGNLSKYIRAQPNSGACFHLAYIPSLPDWIQDTLKTFHRKWGTQKKDILTHCRRELMHAVWKFLLDDDFIHAYKYGMVIKCANGIERRVYPRIFTYSADYPEKVLLATIRDKGLCPCPRCLVPKSQMDLMGLFRDMTARITKAREYFARLVNTAREFIYKKAAPIGGSAVENLLKPTSSVPTVNAFIDRLGDDFNLPQTLVVDLLHEFELGIWKALFTHMIRVLYAAAPNGSLVAELDARFRQIPTFGVDAIRRFAENTSEMKKLAARDFEDILQCAIPAFEGLLDEPHNARVMRLLYRTAEWHGFAKLRMHTDSTLSHLENLTKEFGQLMREFRNVTARDFMTVELPREATARSRRTNNKQARSAPDANEPTPATVVPQHTNGPITSEHSQPSAPTPTVATEHTSPQTPIPASTPAPTSTAPTRKPKLLNLFTYKWHSLGDYVKTIRLFGGTDSYSTQLGELAHRLVKQLYGLTNKRAAPKQIAKHYRRREKARIAFERKALRGKSRHRLSGTHGVTQQPSLDGLGNLSLRYTINHSRNKPLDIATLARKSTDDPAFHRFLPKLQDHLLGRLLERDFDGDAHDDFTDTERNSIRIVNNKVYSSQTCRINYTTYDIRRSQDTINPRSHADVMVRSPETGPNSAPYWYARVVGVYHATVWTSHLGAKRHTPQEMDFLWVRWFGVEPGYRSGFKYARLPKIGFVPSDDEHAFTFLDPSHVIRGVHLLPAFHAGRTSELLPAAESAARVLEDDKSEDWVNFYVGIFADRDMLMRHFGGGVGHLNNSSLTGVDADEDAPGEVEGDIEEGMPAGFSMNDESASDSDNSRGLLSSDESDDGYASL